MRHLDTNDDGISGYSSVVATTDEITDIFTFFNLSFFRHLRDGKVLNLTIVNFGKPQVNKNLKSGVQRKESKAGVEIIKEKEMFESVMSAIQ